MVQEPSFEPLPEQRVPPQSLEAEEAILGALLLDPDAVTRVADTLVPEAFYIGAHRDIYKACLELHRSGRPTDLTSLTAWLQDQGKLDGIGGQSRLAQLVDRVITTANVDQYALIVMDKHLRRQLIKAGNEVIGMGFDTKQPLEQVLDQAEQKVFSITQDRPSSSLVGTAEILTSTFAEIESRAMGTALSGIPCNYYDLDAMTQGFQRSDLIIVAGRPSMGKCLAEDSEILLADGRVTTIRDLCAQGQADLLTLGADRKFHWAQPSCFVDDGFKPVFRVRTRLGRKVETTRTHPFLRLDGWTPLGQLKVGDRIAVPRHLPVEGRISQPEHRLKLLAYLLGDGSITAGVPRFTNRNPRLQQEFAEAITAWPGLTVRQSEDQHRAPTVRVRRCPQQVAAGRQALAQRLAAELTRRSETQRQLAQTLGVSPALICLWLKGNGCPAPEQFRQLCDHWQVPGATLCPEGIEVLAGRTPNPLVQWLEQLGCWGADAHRKQIPDLVFQLPRPQLSLFLNRLFATDGWASLYRSGQAQVGFASASETLIRQLQHLLLRFGIIAAIREKAVRYRDGHRVAWQLTITDRDSLEQFLSEIGIYGKEAALARIAALLPSRRRQFNRDNIPAAVWADLEQAKGDRTWAELVRAAGLREVSNLHVHQRGLSRERLAQLAIATGSESLQQLADSDLYWDEIVAIEPLGLRQVYDLTIPDTHNFVANDICVHNTAIVLNFARNIAILHKLPVCVFSLEMSKEQLVYRLLSMEVGIESGRLRAGRIADHEWEVLTKGIGSLGQLPIFIDDTPGLGISEMRSKTRRLMAESGGKLGLILIDYLQLMEGGNTDNRVQELSRITRGLKALAREVNVPVIALSQLSRGVESRTNKRPMMSDLRESGCLTGETRITLADTGASVPLRDLIGQQGFRVWALNTDTYRIEAATVSCAFSTGNKPVFRLRTASGRTIRATANHPFFTLGGWKRLDELEVNTSYIALPRQLPESDPGQTLSDAELGLLGHLIGDGCTLPRHAIQYTTCEPDLAELVKQLAEETFGDRIAPRIQAERRWYQVYLSATKPVSRSNRNPIAQWLDDLGIWGLRSHEKRLPERIFEQPQSAIARFLRHLWSTDGCIKLVGGQSPRPIAYYASSSECLARQVQSLLMRLGIASTFRLVDQGSKGRPQHHVIISGKTDILKFLEQVGTLGSRKQQAASQIRESLSERISNTNRDVVPAELWSLHALPTLGERGLTHREFQRSLGQQYCGHQLYRQNLSRERTQRVASTLASPVLEHLATSDIYWDLVVAIEPDGIEEVFDLTVPGPHNFLANDIFVHNSIEQDADLIMMIYRDEYYNPETPDRGITEVIVTKHRNGPVGTVKLLFEPQYTRFRNLAGPGGAG